MNNPDGELEIKRAEDGRVVGISYKVNKEGEQGKRAIECLDVLKSVAEAALASEGPEDHGVYIPIDIHMG